MGVLMTCNVCEKHRAVVEAAVALLRTCDDDWQRKNLTAAALVAREALRSALIAAGYLEEESR